MSFGIVIKGTEGLVLAAESRVMIAARNKEGREIMMNFDNASKIYAFSEPNSCTGVVTYGLAALGLRTVYSYLPEFEATLPKTRLSVSDMAHKLSEFFMRIWNESAPSDYNGPNVTFVLAGFDQDQPYGTVYQIEIPAKPDPVGKNTKKNEFGIVWGGMREFVDRLIQGFDPRLPAILSEQFSMDESSLAELRKKLMPLQMQIPLQAMPLQDCIDLALFFARTTIGAQRFTMGIKGCGGPIDVAVITSREGFRFIKQKELSADTT